MALVGSLLVSLSANTSEFERGMQRSRQQVQQTQQAIGQAQVSFAGLGTTLAGVAAGAISLGALKAGIEDVVRTGTAMQQLRATFTALTGSATLGGQQFGFVRDTANRLGLDLQTLGENYKGLTAATRGTALEGQGTQDLFVALSSAARTYGLSTEQTGRALVAFQQIISKGKVSQEEYAACSLCS